MAIGNVKFKMGSCRLAEVVASYITQMSLNVWPVSIIYRMFLHAGFVHGIQ